MASPTYYNTGTASVANGATTITFTSALLGTAIYPNIQPGDLFMDPAQPMVPPQRIASVNYAEGEAELAVGWPGTTIVTEPYEVRFASDVSRSTAQNRRVLEMMGQLVPLGIQPNAIGTFAERDVYDGAAKGFIFLALEDPWVLYAKLSGDDADWDDGFVVEGAPGDDGVQSSNDSVTDIIAVTQAEYDALSPPNGTTFYLIKD